MTPSALPHALVVGGTGMLRELSLELARRGHMVSVLARSAARLQALADAAPGRRIHPIALDYHDTAALTAGLERATARHGPIRLAVVWIHGSAPEAPLSVARFVRGVYLHVLGSAAADPGRPDPDRRARFAACPELDYREVILGFVRENGASRWLTDEEIGRGVLAALDAGAARAVVGTLEPWSARP